MERRMGDSLLRWLGLDKPPHCRVRHKVWKKQLADNTRQLRLGADRARQKTELEMLDGTEVVRGWKWLEQSQWLKEGCGWEQMRIRLQRQVATQSMISETWTMNVCGRSGIQVTGLRARGQTEGLMEGQERQWLLLLRLRLRQVLELRQQRLWQWLVQRLSMLRAGHMAGAGLGAAAAEATMGAEAGHEAEDVQLQRGGGWKRHFLRCSIISLKVRFQAF